MIESRRMSDEAAAQAAGNRLAAVGLRRTPRRARVLALLVEAARPMSHLELHAAIGRHRADRVSIYRALEAFVAKGLVHRTCVDGRTWLYESADRCGADQCHPHFTCRVCGVVRCLEHVALPTVKRIGVGYVAERQSVSITGLCPECREAGGGT